MCVQVLCVANEDANEKKKTSYRLLHAHITIHHAHDACVYMAYFYSLSAVLSC